MNEERRTHPRHPLETPAELEVDTPEPSAETTDKRAHERVSVGYEISIEAGLKIAGQEVMRLTLVGTTIDVSLGGMLIRVDQDVIPGARCEVHFPDAEGRIEPEKTRGRVRRSKASAKGFELGVQFDTPLDKLES
jgi:hypothetical protein